MFKAPPIIAVCLLQKRRKTVISPLILTTEWVDILHQSIPGSHFFFSVSRSLLCLDQVRIGDEVGFVRSEVFLDQRQNDLCEEKNIWTVGITIRNAKPFVFAASNEIVYHTSRG